MKKILILLFLLVMAFQSFSQNTKNPISKEDYLAKSQKQKKKAYILLGVGGGAAAVGGILVASNFCIFGCTDSQEAGLGTGTGLLIAGGISMAASIPVFISSSSNAKRAAELSFNSQPVYLPKHANAGPKSFPSLELSIPL